MLFNIQIFEFKAISNLFSKRIIFQKDFASNSKSEIFQSLIDFNNFTVSYLFHLETNIRLNCCESILYYIRLGENI